MRAGEGLEHCSARQSVSQLAWASEQAVERIDSASYYSFVTQGAFSVDDVLRSGGLA